MIANPENPYATALCLGSDYVSEWPINGGVRVLEGGWERLNDGTQLVSGLFLKVSRVLAFALRRALDGGGLYQQLCWQRPGWLGSVNSSSSMGAPFSTMNATRTPSDGLLGGIRISRPASSEARSATSNATCGTCRTRSGTAASASKRIHSTPNSLFSWLTTKSFRCFKWVSPGFASVVGIPM